MSWRFLLRPTGTNKLNYMFGVLQVAGTSGKVHIDGDSDDEGISSEEHGSAIIEALGWDRRNEASIFLPLLTMNIRVIRVAPSIWAYWYFCCKARYARSLPRTVLSLCRLWRASTWHAAMWPTLCALQRCTCGRQSCQTRRGPWPRSCRLS